MAKTIKWNKRALRKIREITGFLQTEVSDKAANNFVDAVYHQIRLLDKQPLIGRRELSMKTIRFVNVDKHRQMFYRVKGSTLHIVNFFDTRQNPKKRPY